MKQTTRILNYIDTFGSISSMEAFVDLGITRLAARIHDIEETGVRIARQMEKTTNRFGEPVRYMRYSRWKETQ